MKDHETIKDLVEAGDKATGGETTAPRALALFNSGYRGQREVNKAAYLFPNADASVIEKALYANARPAMKALLEEVEQLRAESKSQYMSGYESAKGEYRDRLVGAEDKVEQQAATIEAMRGALEEIAMQFTSDEWEEEGDTEYGYDTIIKVARKALAASKGEKQ